MKKSISLLDKDYSRWISELSSRYRKSQIKAAVKVNEEMLRFYWELGRDIVEMRIEERWGDNVIKTLSADLQQEIPDAHCFSRTNLYYIRNFYLLYSQYVRIIPQLEGKFVPQPEGQILQQSVATSESHSQLIDRFFAELFSVPWGHHKLLMDKCPNNPQKALFFVHQTVKNGWSRNMLLNFLDTDLYERQGKALTNFERTLPSESSELAKELTKDPYNFAFTGITGKYNERLLKDKLLNNITQFLVELGTGFAYVGKEYRLQIGDTENFIDLLFYNLNLSCYVVSCNHLLRKEGRDNPTIGLLICKEKDSLVAQYALEASSQPLGISEYELAKLYPEKVEGTIPTIEELEQKLGERIKNIED